MEKSMYDKIINVLFIIAIGLTFLSLFRVIFWLSILLCIVFIALIIINVKDYETERSKNKRSFILYSIILINFFLSNAVVLISHFIYPY